jgi:hypothetical protein
MVGVVLRRARLVEPDGVDPTCGLVRVAASSRWKIRLPVQVAAPAICGFRTTRV